MSAACPQAMENVGAGIAAALKAVDCVASDVTAQAFGRQFAPGGALDTVLTLVLTLYVAFFAISLMLGRSNLGVRALLPRIITIGLVLTFATSWVAFRSVVANLFIDAPDYLATILTASKGSATQDFAAKLDVVFMAVQQATEGQQSFEAFSPAGMMWMGATMFLLGTVGILVTARIGLALLVAIGPIFVVMALFEGTRGLFTGWLKGLVFLGLTPILAVLGGSVMLELAVPVLARLTQLPGELDPQASMAFFLMGAVHLALMGLALKVGSTMVAGWDVFGMVERPAMREETSLNQPLSSPAARELQMPPTRSETPAQTRRIDLQSSPIPSPVNDQGAVSQSVDRQVRAYAARNVAPQLAGGSAAATRTSGIGNRFRKAGLPPRHSQSEILV